MSRILGLVALAGVVLVAGASVGLSQPPPVPKNPLAGRGDTLPVADCKNIMQELARLKGMASEHNQAIGAFTDEMIVTMGRWHQQLVGLEGKTSEIPVNQFLPIKTGAAQVSEVQALVWDNGDFLDGRFNDLLDALPRCLK